MPLSRRLFIALAAPLLLATPLSPAYALTLDQAKARGLLGERPDGLLGAVTGSLPADAARLMERINSERMAKYRQIAAQNGTSVQAVQAVVGEKLIRRAAPGTYVWQNGRWVKK